ncbi:hypothetical protein K3495_g8581 [Podosphaera aphanis]|nr:hypothetical protein K3495_g8581 [Podosphaera aphanis]
MVDMSISAEHLAELSKYTACDIADALLKLHTPNAGYLPDLNLITSASSFSPKSRTTIAPASTLLFRPKVQRPEDGPQCLQESNIPAGKHWVDLTPSGSILIISQPENQKCAVLGGIMALRMKMLGVRGVVVWGRVRDLRELAVSGVSIWAKGSSVVSSAAESAPQAIQITLDINGTIVKPGDVVFADHDNGVVVIPLERLKEVLALLLDLSRVDEHIINDVRNGVSVYDTLTRFRDENDLKKTKN